jgi:alcohol dehydrogenase class IV
LKKIDSHNLWSYSNPVKIISDSLDKLTQYVSFSGNTLIISSQSFDKSKILEDLISQIGPHRIFAYSQVSPNPDLDNIDNFIEEFKGKDIQNIIGLGGGSVMDFSKVASVTLDTSLIKPLDLIFRKNYFQDFKRTTSLILIPTTTGTGSEVTPFATIWDNHDCIKRSLLTNSIYPDIAYLDPRLTMTLSSDQIFYTTLDLISHCLESLWNKNKSPITVSFSYHALTLVIDSYDESNDLMAIPNSLNKLQEAATIAGLAISQTKTALSHSISYPLTIRYRIPHGLAVGFTLAPLLRLNINSIAENPYQLNILLKILDLLESVDILEHVNRLVTQKEIELIFGEMITKDRSANYNGLMSDNLEGLIKRITVLPK